MIQLKLKVEIVKPLCIGEFMVPQICLLSLVIFMINSIHWPFKLPSLNQNYILTIQLILNRSNMKRLWIFGTFDCKKQFYLLELDPRKHPALSEYLKLEGRSTEGGYKSDLEFVKKFTRPNFRAKEFYTLKTPKLRLFSPPVNSKNASSSVIWPSFGSKWTKCVNSLTVVKEVYI